MMVNSKLLQALGNELLLAIGEDPLRPGLVDTPRRWADWWQEFMDYDPGRLDVTFEAIETDQMVIVSGLRVYSLCEHHLLPFWADISIGYITVDKVLGLSKFARIAHTYAHRLQIQERLVQQIADTISEYIDSEDVAVYASGIHLCMISRGVKTHGVMKTSVMRGAFRENADARREFLSLISQNDHLA